MIVAEKIYGFNIRDGGLRLATKKVTNGTVYGCLSMDQKLKSIGGKAVCSLNPSCAVSPTVVSYHM